MEKAVNNFFKWTGVFLSGLISGLAVGFLSAPKSGRELRNDLAYESKKWQRNAQEKIDELQEASKTKAEDVAHAVRNTADKIGSKVNNLLNSKHQKREEEKATY